MRHLSRFTAFAGLSLCLLVAASPAHAACDLAADVHNDTFNVQPGEKIKIATSVKNKGSEDSARSTAQFKLSTDETIDPDDQTIDDARVKVLVKRTGSDLFAVHDSWDREFEIDAPSEPGTYYYGLCVDKVSCDKNTENNCSVAVEVRVGIAAD